MIGERIADVAIIIVGFRSPMDIVDCLAALSKAAPQPSFDVFICENGGEASFRQLIHELLAAGGPCQAANDGLETSVASIPGRLTVVRHLRLRTRASSVWVACAAGNLGYAAGINAWLERLHSVAGWSGVWILNPDTQPEPHALAALVERAQINRKGMVGSTILAPDRPNTIHCRGGLRWQRLTARSVLIGYRDDLGAPCDVTAIEAAMDCPSGACMYVTRTCLDEIGLMDERYFLFYEDLDWGLRAKICGLGYASASIVAHKRGTTTGSAQAPASIPRLSVYLQHRNRIHLVRKHFPWAFPLCMFSSILYAVKFLIGRAPSNFKAALQGMFAGLKGEIGPPGKKFLAET